MRTRKQNQQPRACRVGISCMKVSKKKMQYVSQQVVHQPLRLSLPFSNQRTLSLLLLNNRNPRAITPKHYPTPRRRLAPGGRTPTLTSRQRRDGRRSRGLGLERLAVVGDDGQQRALKDVLDARHLLAAALHVLRAHLLGDGEALLRRDGCEALRLEHVDAGALVAQVGFEAD